MSDKSMKKLSIDDINRVAKLANLPLDEKQASQLTKHVGTTVSYVSKLQDLKTENVLETAQVTGLENVFREDEIDTKRMFSQDEALSNAKRSHKGFFVVDAIFEE